MLGYWVYLHSTLLNPVKMGKHIVMLLASEKFRDCEFIVPKAFFEQSAIKVSIASTKLLAKGRFGYSVSSDILIEYLNPGDYDGIFFVGGAGSVEYIDNLKAKEVFENFLKLNKFKGII